MLKAIRYNSESESLNLGRGFFRRIAIDHDPRKVGYLGDPTTVFFLFQFDLICDHLATIIARIALTAKVT
jgi:hypothetical protein